MINTIINEYETLTKKIFPNSQLDFENSTSKETLKSLFKSIEIIDVYANSTATLDSWIISKLNELKNQLLISLYYLPHYSLFIFASFQRSISELLLKLTLYSVSETPKNIEYQNKVNTLQFRSLKKDIKDLKEYSNQSFKIQMDNLFSLYGNSSNDIHLKNASTIIEYIEAYNVISESDIKQVKSLAIKVEEYLLSIFPKIHNLNDTEFNIQAKIQLKKVLSTQIYDNYFIYPTSN